MKWLDWLLAFFDKKPAPGPQDHYAALQLKYKDQSVVKPNRKLCAELLVLLDPQQYKKYDPHYGRTVTLSAEISNLEAFTKKLQDASAMVIRDYRIPNDWVRTDEVVVPFDKLFIDSGGFYITDFTQAVSKFKTAASRLCELMEASDDATHGIHEHNLRMLSRLFVQLRDVTTSMVEVSLQQ
ncbi:hypothetical protein [Burkholderia phage FLC9]|nr:hypothetical protein [Burkholderia phage FLC9]